jgi:hypothetical protein
MVGRNDATPCAAIEAEFVEPAYRVVWCSDLRGETTHMNHVIK